MGTDSRRCYHVSMGTWGSGNFENDAALDFRAEVEGADDPDLLLERVREVVELDDDDELDAELCCELLVAAEYFAAALGRPAHDSERPAGDALIPWEWKPTNADVGLCAAAVRRVATDSELSELWAESKDGLDEWAEVLEDLLARLGEEGL